MGSWRRSESTIADPNLGPLRVRGLSRGQLRSIMLELDRVDLEQAAQVIGIDADDAGELSPAAQVRAVLFQHRIARAGLLDPTPPALAGEVIAEVPLAGWLIDADSWEPAAIRRIYEAVMRLSDTEVVE